MTLMKKPKRMIDKVDGGASTRRLIAVGCLLMLAPLLVAIVSALLVGWPLLFSILPRGMRPVPAAQADEVLVLVTDFNGQNGHNPAGDLDRSLLDITGYFYYDLRIGRLNKQPSNQQAARRLGQTYQASIVIWGSYDASTYTVNYEILNPIDPFEPEHFSFLLQQDEPLDWLYLETFSEALLRAHTVAYSYDYSSAENALSRLPADTTLDPTIVAIYQANTARLQGYDFKALEILQQAVEDDAADATVYALMSVLLYETGEPEAADRAMKEALALAPDSTGVYYARGLINLGEERYDEAVEDFTRLLDRFPDDQALLLQRAEAYVAMGDYSQAIDDYNRLIDLTPYDNYQYYMMRGNAYWEVGNVSAAHDDWQYTLDRNFGANASGYNNLAWEMALQGYYEPALEYANTSLGMSPNNPDALHTRGYIYLGLSEWEDALEDFRKAMNNGLSYDPVYRDMGDAYFGMGDYQRAIDSYENYLQIAPYAEDYDDITQKLREARDLLQAQ
jgi:tetratricopeptide (TPR) repeat protein